ncbi:MAG: hypothetical protein MI806_26525 [Minwuiales bacterium]|nr:hypothetical protein [Minwuiales bacterium]
MRSIRGAPAFSTFYEDGDTLIYQLESGTRFEIGIGRYRAAEMTIERVTVLRSSSWGRKVRFTGPCRIYPTALPQRGYARMIPFGETAAVLSERLKLALAQARRRRGGAPATAWAPPPLPPTQDTMLRPSPVRQRGRRRPKR